MLDFLMDDGCSGIPDIIFGVDLTECCRIHDETLVSTYDMSVFDQANVAFAHCVWDAGLWWLALPALFVVSTVGVLLFVFGPKRRAQ